jgi:hypothetical protein
MAQNLHEILLRVKALFLKRRMERDMADELAFHQALLQEKMLLPRRVTCGSRDGDPAEVWQRQPMA